MGRGKNPHHTHEERLKEFYGVSLDGATIPTSFIAYYQTAIDGKMFDSGNTSITLLSGTYR